MDEIECRRCGEEEAPRLPKPPFPNELGERIQEEICRNCWSDWLDHQTVLINHYGLDVRDPKSRRFLYEKVEEILLEGGTDDEIDTSMQGDVEW